MARRLALLALSCLALGAVSVDLARRAGVRLASHDAVHAILRGEGQSMEDLAIEAAEDGRSDKP